jgi:hypothetical protein
MSGGFLMLHISAVIAVLALIGMTACVSAAQPQTSACSMEKCIETCKKNNYSKCDRYCEMKRANSNCR